MRTWLALLPVLLALTACASVPTPAAVGSATGETPNVATAVLTQSPRGGQVHRNEGAGRWYPADPAKLRATVDAYVEQAEIEPPPGRLVAVIVPHAGYVYSGDVAGHAFRAAQEAGCAAQGKAPVVAVIGDTHTGNGSAEIAVWAAGAFETPLGNLAVDEEVAQALVAADPRIRFDRDAFENEHPVENQLPFLQAVCPEARIVPVVIREPSLQNAQVLAGALVAAIGDRPVLIVASTDLSHYHTYDEALKMDQVALQAMTSLDAQAVADSSRRCAELGLGGGDPLTMCSQGAVMTALLAARQMGANRATVLRYANSGDSPLGDRAQVVGYGAVALWQAAGNSPGGGTVPNLDPPMASVPAEPIPVSPEGQRALLALARQTAEQFLANETFPPFHTDDLALLQPLGAYVTYEHQGELRGCVGRIEADRPAYLNVQYAAVAAALADSRFPPITAGELDNLTIEITMLQPLRLVASPDQIQIGRDGVLMRIGADKGALFLPQVPPEEGWDLQATLVNLSRKAGLPDNAWQQPDARLYVFAGQWFGEGH